MANQSRDLFKKDVLDFRARLWSLAKCVFLSLFRFSSPMGGVIQSLCLNILICKMGTAIPKYVRLLLCGLNEIMCTSLSFQRLSNVHRERLTTITGVFR